MPIRSPFSSVTNVKRAIKVARDFGFTVTSYEISADGGIVVRFGHWLQLSRAGNLPSHPQHGVVG
jgi:hypothetical protein